MEKLYKIFLTDTALKNLEDLSSADITTILDTLKLLEAFPKIGSAIEKPKWLGYRQIIVNWYRIVYKIDEKKKLITVHLVKHGKMNFS